jgi:predicted Zn-dependent peptidase
MTRKSKKTIKLIHKELDKLKESQLSPQMLERAKNKFKGQIALAEKQDEPYYR